MENFSNIILLTSLSHKVCLPLSSAVLLHKLTNSDNYSCQKGVSKLVTLVILLNEVTSTKNTWSSSAAIKNLLKVKSLKHHFA